jgi:hypothetical protein
MLRCATLRVPHLRQRQCLTRDSRALTACDARSTTRDKPAARCVLVGFRTDAHRHLPHASRARGGGVSRAARRRQAAFPNSKSPAVRARPAVAQAQRGHPQDAPTSPPPPAVPRRSQPASPHGLAMKMHALRAPRTAPGCAAPFKQPPQGGVESSAARRASRPRLPAHVRRCAKPPGPPSCCACFVRPRAFTSPPALRRAPDKREVRQSSPLVRRARVEHETGQRCWRGAGHAQESCENAKATPSSHRNDGTLLRRTNCTVPSA